MARARATDANATPTRSSFLRLSVAWQSVRVAKWIRVRARKRTVSRRILLHRFLGVSASTTPVAYRDDGFPDVLLNVEMTAWRLEAHTWRSTTSSLLRRSCGDIGQGLGERISFLHRDTYRLFVAVSSHSVQPFGENYLPEVAVQRQLFLTPSKAHSAEIHPFFFIALPFNFASQETEAEERKKSLISSI